MNQLDRELSRRLNEVRAEHDSTRLRHAGDVKREVLRRTRRRRTLKSTGAAVMTAGLVAGVSLVPAPWTGGDFDGRGPAAAARGGEKLGVWPALTESEAGDLCGSMDLRPRLAAGGLIGETLGWTDVVAYNEPDPAGGHLSLRYRRVGRGFGATGDVGALPGARIPEHPGVTVELSRLGPECWWVTSMESLGDEDVHVTVDDDVLHVEYDLPGEAASADVIVLEQGMDVRRYVSGEPGETSVEVEPFEGPGSVIVLWKSASGWIMTGESRALSPH